MNSNLRPENMKILYNILNALIDGPMQVFEFKNFSNLMNHLSTIFQYELSISILDNLVNKFNLGTVNNKTKLKTLLEFIEPMIKMDQPDLSEFLLNKSIYKISKLVYVPASKDPYEQLEMFQNVKKALINSTKNNNEYLSEKKLIIYLTNYINCLCLFGLNISETYDNLVNDDKDEENEKDEKDEEKKSQLQLDFCNNYNFNNKKFDVDKDETFLAFYKLLFKEINSVFDIIKPLSLERALKLYIQCGQMVNGLKFDEIEQFETFAYEYINNALLILKKENKKEDNNNKNTDNKNNKNSDNTNTNTNATEEDEIIEENQKFNYLTNIIGAVSTMDIFTEKHLNDICSNIEKMIEGLVKRREQCLLMLKCINLYCNEVEEDTNKIVALFSKAKKYAVYSMTNPENTILFVYILNEYIRLDGVIKDFDKTVKVNDVEEIIETINNYLISMKNENKDSEMIKRIEDYYKNTIDCIKQKKGDKKYKLMSTLKI